MVAEICLWYCLCSGKLYSEYCEIILIDIYWSNGLWISYVIDINYIIDCLCLYLTCIDTFCYKGFSWLINCINKWIYLTGSLIGELYE